MLDFECTRMYDYINERQKDFRNGFRKERKGIYYARLHQKNRTESRECTRLD